LYSGKGLATSIIDLTRRKDMLTYLYAFDVSGQETYYVYAPSKVEAISMYLEENELKELPKTCTITRTNG
jgi:hypothetical protein